MLLTAVVLSLAYNYNSEYSSLHFQNIDTSMMSSGILAVEDKGAVYHLVTGDTLEKQKVLSISVKNDTATLQDETSHKIYIIHVEKNK